MELYLRAALVFLTLLSLIIGSAYPKHLKALSRETRSIFSKLGLVTDIGSTAISAAQAYYETQERNNAKVLININNLSKWPLANTQIRILAGETTNVPNIVLPGYKERIAANQAGPNKRFTQGYVAFDASPNFYCVFYWYIEGSSKIKKQGNSLGVGCVRKEQTIENHDVLNDINPDSNSNDFLKFGEFNEKSQDSIRYCSEDLCVLGIVGSSNQVEANIDIIPRRVENLASKLFDNSPAAREDLDQDALNSFLFGDNCKIDCSEALVTKPMKRDRGPSYIGQMPLGVFVYVIAVVGALFASIVCSCICFCCCRRRNFYYYSGTRLVAGIENMG